MFWLGQLLTKHRVLLLIHFVKRAYFPRFYYVMDWCYYY